MGKPFLTYSHLRLATDFAKAVEDAHLPRLRRRVIMRHDVNGPENNNQENKICHDVAGERRERRRKGRGLQEWLRQI